MRHVGDMACEDESVTLGAQNADKGFGEHRLGIRVKEDPISKLMSVKSNNELQNNNSLLRSL